MLITMMIDSSDAHEGPSMLTGFHNPFSVKNKRKEVLTVAGGCPSATVL